MYIYIYIYIEISDDANKNSLLRSNKISLKSDMVYLQSIFFMFEQYSVSSTLFGTQDFVSVFILST